MPSGCGDQMETPRPATSFFFNDTPTTEIYPLSLHDALPICQHRPPQGRDPAQPWPAQLGQRPAPGLRGDRKSTRLNSSHLVISYAVFCLKKKKKNTDTNNISNKLYHDYTSNTNYHQDARLDG